MKLDQIRERITNLQECEVQLSRALDNLESSTSPGETQWWTEAVQRWTGHVENAAENVKLAFHLYRYNIDRLNKED